MMLSCFFERMSFSVSFLMYWGVYAVFERSFVYPASDEECCWKGAPQPGQFLGRATCMVFAASSSSSLCSSCACLSASVTREPDL